MDTCVHTDTGTCIYTYMSLSIYRDIPGCAQAFAVQEQVALGPGEQRAWRLIPGQQWNSAVTRVELLRFCSFSAFPLEKLSKAHFQLCNTMVNTELEIEDRLFPGY